MPGSRLTSIYRDSVEPGAAESVAALFGREKRLEHFREELGWNPRSVILHLDAHLVLNAEGAASASSPKTRFIFPALAIAAAGLSFHQDYNSQGVPDQDIAGRAESGAVGLGLIGTVLAQTSRTLASSIAFTGAGFSVYSTFIARGQDVILPENTPVTVSLGARGGEAGAGQRVRRALH